MDKKTFINAPPDIFCEEQPRGYELINMFFSDKSDAEFKSFLAKRMPSRISNFDEEKVTIVRSSPMDVQAIIEEDAYSFSNNPEIKRVRVFYDDVEVKLSALEDNPDELTVGSWWEDYESDDPEAEHEADGIKMIQDNLWVGISNMKT